jgi:hypothetical protein
MKNPSRLLIPLFILIILVFTFIIVRVIYKNNIQKHETGLSINKTGNTDPDLSYLEKDLYARIMTPEELKKAELSLATGIIINDGQNDFFQLTGELKPDEEDGRYDNFRPYPLPYTDVKNVSVGADNTYIYFKFLFYGNFPKEIPVYDNDTLEVIVTKVEELSSASSGIEPYEINTDLMYGRYDGKGKVTPITPQFDHYAFISTDGGMKDRNTNGLVGGGLGYDYIFVAYPLSILNVKLGDEVTFRTTSETASSKYHHEVIDSIGSGPDSKFSMKIKYKLGSKTYDNLGTK